MSYFDEEIQQKPQVLFLDFSSYNPQTKNEVDSLLHRLPDMRLRPDTTNLMKEKSEYHAQAPDEFADPVPYPMRKISMRELSSVEIVDWKMLTLYRPIRNQETIFYDKLIQLDQLMLKSYSKIQERKKGKNKAEVTDLDEFTYEYFSIHKGEKVDSMDAKQIDVPNIQPQAVLVTDDSDGKNYEEEEESSPLKIKRRKLKHRKKGSKKRRKGTKKRRKGTKSRRKGTKKIRKGTKKRRKGSKKRWKRNNLKIERKLKSICSKIKPKLKRKVKASTFDKRRLLKITAVKLKRNKIVKSKHVLMKRVSTKSKEDNKSTNQKM